MNLNTLFLSVRVLHVVFAGLWLGTAFLASMFVMPAIKEAGPEGGKVMIALMRRRLPVYISSVAGMTVLTGFWLYWRFTEGFDPGISSSMGGRVFGAGGVLGLVAAIIAGSVVARNMKKIVALMQQASAQADAAARTNLIDQASRLRSRTATAARIVTVLLIVTAMLMALGHYV